MFKRFIAELTPENQAGFRNETNALMHQREFAVLIIGVTLIPLFSFLDLVSVREHFLPFLRYRIICALMFVVMIGLHRTSYFRAQPYPLAVFMYVTAGGMISMMNVTLGGYGSFYYPGIILVLVTCSAILPLTAFQGFIAAITTYMLYIVPIVLFNSPRNLDVFYTNNFFFISFMLISVLKCWEETRLRVRRYNMRLKLEYYNQHLEDEVDKRAKELEESEIRYRDLYDNIVDMVILVNAKGQVIMANPRFYSLIGFDEQEAGGMNLIDYIDPEDIEKVREQLLKKLPNINSIRDFEFRLKNVIGQVFIVECNAKQIKKKDRHVGFQMVIRDITERKRLETQLIESYHHIEAARASTILGLAKLAEYRDHSTGAHLERIREYAKVVATQLAKHPKYEEYITAEYIEAIYQSSILHDIGKVGIPDAILMKPNKLLPDEFEVIKRHTTFGGDALKAVEETIQGKSFLTIGKEIAYYHHEKWDGSGYPKGLKGEQIPLSTRIVALADVYDALTSAREYKPAYSHEKAASILLEEKGKHFDPDVVDAFMATQETFRQIREKINLDLGCAH